MPCDRVAVASPRFLASVKYMKPGRFSLYALILLLAPMQGHAHVSEGSFVLLLPTDVYSAAGVAVVALTVVLVAFGDDRLLGRVYGTRWERPARGKGVRTATSLLALALLAAAIWLGLNGPRDPNANLLPLLVWTVGWIGLVSLSGFTGNLWLWLNPWTGLYRLVGRPRPILSLPPGMGHWPAVVMLLLFSAFLLAYWAPSDPERLALCLIGYWGFIMAGLLLAGPRWLDTVEIGHAINGLYGSLAVLFLSRDTRALGGPGAHLLRNPPGPALGLVAVVLLGIGSFDGLNETFWWLARIGVNPLEFPGRTAIVGETLIGLALANLALVGSVALSVWLGLRLCRGGPGFTAAFNWLALSLLPIALAYHIAHYLPSFLVEIQYFVAALSDPLGRGDDLLGIEPFHVTTGLFNRIDTVRLIWLSQAGAVVLGHVWSILLSHAIGLRLFDNRRDAVWATLPLSVFMVGYTFLGLWLLAAAKGA